jgi:DNA-directed RNA polymerase subunit alpha
MIFDKLKAKFKKPNPDLVKTILELDFTVKTYNVLSRAGIATVGDLTQLSWNDIMILRKSVRKTCEEVEKVLDEMGLGLRKDDGK